MSAMFANRTRRAMSSDESQSSEPPRQPAEAQRLADAHARKANWQRWGSYLAERQWGTVREDYSEYGNCWDYFTHDQARSRAYRWGEDGLLGFTDRECRLCFALALWNGQDPILKERLFGLTGPEGNHGEDVKECYYYLDATPTHSYMKSLYKYPQAEYPYAWLVEENRRRGRGDAEFELADSGVFNENRYFDVTAEYAKASPDDVVVRITVANRGPEAATIHLLPTLWFRNSWSWGCDHEGCEVKPRLEIDDSRTNGNRSVIAQQASLGKFRMIAEAGPDGAAPTQLFTENETNAKRLYDFANATPHTKDAFHDYVVHGRKDAVNPEGHGTKTAWHYVLDVPAGGEIVIRLRLFADAEADGKGFGEEFEHTFARRIWEADEFYAARIDQRQNLSPDERQVARQAYAGLLFSKQFYHLVVKNWLDGDPEQPAPPAARKHGRNHDWPHLFNRDVISMPDKWEYPWYAAWDLAFHMLPMARVDGEFAKEQLLLFLREWYMHPNGQMPAYEFAFGDVNPPVHAWACWRVYKMTGQRGHRDRLFLRRAFHKLLINFTWWVNRKDPQGRNLFAGGFLGLDNIGVFDRSQPLPGGQQLEQADGTAWMAFYCATMLSMALELAADDSSYEDIASKFFEHFVSITDAMNSLGGMGLWDEQDGFYYDVLSADGTTLPLRIRSIVGIIPLFAVEILEQQVIDRLPGFTKRLEWFLQHRKDLARHISYCDQGIHDGNNHGHVHRLLAVPSRERLVRVLRYVLDENEFLSPYGIRALSRYHHEHPYQVNLCGMQYRVDYTPAESTTGLFGGNSNWRGPIWFPVNYLLVEALERYFHFYGDSLQVECPTGSGQMMNLKQVAAELSTRLTRLFLPDESGRRPCHGDDRRYADDPHWRELVLFHEYFHGDTGRGVGASHQTGWTAMVAELLHGIGQRR
jgi:Mannosylglycerate hydrolase MGH1-like glycoside hydrolase domain/Glycosyl hydrolase family 63 C-terminal domain